MPISFPPKCPNVSNKRQTPKKPSSLGLFFRHSLEQQLLKGAIIFLTQFGMFLCWRLWSKKLFALACGGHINHSIFWKNLIPTHEGGGEPPKGSLGWAIDMHFGSFEELLQKMSTEGAALQGSGWVWLGLDKDLKKLVVETTANQDPLVTKGASLVPLLGIDVWEHAYYLQYKNVRPDYLMNIWKVINWKYASELYEKESPLISGRL